ncbi:protein NRT1/ PTR FAMILY 5.10-like [Oryza glaberrima]|uniref:Major facilitator superfamily (MFS) profile domain-containing protein n=1 Tax=Oryza glaberrima TaxID=4538 RepID=I1PVW4_ORYGL|nr:protein NRT1/ PTR FAMILY 5.10-like [Oryza glaberrima]
MPSGSDSGSYDPLLALDDGMADGDVAAAAAAPVDHRGRPALRGATGGWRSALFIIAVEIAERFAFYGVSANLITYLTGSLGEGNAAAAAAINAWNGVSQLLPLLGGALADSWLGRYRTILLASLLYILGLAMLAFSTFISTGGNQCSSAAVAGGKTCPPSTLRVAFFYISLYMVAVAQGGHKPCVQAFGADQFDPSDPEESVSRSSFFNWWYFGMCGGTAVTLVFLSYVQDNIGWGLGFGIPCVVMACALAVFLLGTRTYRYYVSGSKKGVVARAGEALAAWRNRAKSIPLLPPASQECHPTATSAPEFSTGVEEDEQVVGKAGLVEQAKGIVRLFPIWATCLIYAVALAQSSTFFTKQAGTLDRRIGDHIQVPPAALQSFISITIVAIIPVYDRVIVPVARRYTGVPSGITMLQRIGAGMVLSLVSMVIAALVETRRLRAARDAGLVDKAGVPVPMSLWWMVPQYVLFGAADVFTMVGLQEFFYDQVPDKLRSLGLALYLSIFGVGSFISSALVSGIDRATAARGGSWFSNNLNRAHLDYFYWLIAALSALELLAYGYFAVTFKYKNKNKGALLATSTSC